MMRIEYARTYVSGRSDKKKRRLAFALPMIALEFKFCLKNNGLSD